MSQLFTSGGQSIGVSASASVLPMNIQDWFPLRLTDLLPVQGTLKSLLQNHSSKASIIQSSAFFIVQLSHPYMTTGKIIALTRWTFVGKIISLLFNMLSRLVITFLPRRKRLLISWLQSPSAVILEPPKIKSATVSTVSPSISHEVMGPDAMILVFWMLSFKPTFSLSSFTFIKIAGRNINNFTYADDTTLMAESEEELKSFLTKVKEESEKVVLKLNIQKTKIMAFPMTSWEIDGKTVETVADFIFLGCKITADGDCSHEMKRRLLLGRKVMTNLDSIFKSRDITLCRLRSI